MSAGVVLERHGRLAVLKITRRRHASTGERRSWALCRCDCGEKCGAWLGSVRSGNTSSCGCLHRERSAKRLAERNSAGKGVKRGRYKPREGREVDASAVFRVGVAAPESSVARSGSTGQASPICRSFSEQDIFAMISGSRKIA